jgi:transcriptional regulator with XRE-family HTH domain
MTRTHETATDVAGDDHLAGRERGPRAHGLPRRGRPRDARPAGRGPAGDRRHGGALASVRPPRRKPGSHPWARVAGRRVRDGHTCRPRVAGAVQLRGPGQLRVAPNAGYGALDREGALTMSGHNPDSRSSDSGPPARTGRPPHGQRPPPGTWDDPALAAALRDRDIATIYHHLQERGYTQRHIAALTGQGQNEVSDVLLRGRAVTTYDVLLRIAEGLGIPRGRMGLGYGDIVFAPGWWDHTVGRTVTVNLGGDDEQAGGVVVAAGVARKGCSVVLTIEITDEASLLKIGMRRAPGYQEAEAAFDDAMRAAAARVPPPTPEQEAELDARPRERLLAGRVSEAADKDLAGTRDDLARIVQEGLPDALRRRANAS